MFRFIKSAPLALAVLAACLPQVVFAQTPKAQSKPAQTQPADADDAIPKDMFPPKGPLKLVPVFRAPKGDVVFVDESSIKMESGWAEVWSLRIFAEPTKIGSVALWRRADFNCKRDEVMEQAFVSLDPAGKIIKHVPGYGEESINSARWRDDGAIVAVACGRRKATGPHFASVAKASQAGKAADKTVWKPMVDLPAKDVFRSSPSPSPEVPIEPVSLTRVFDGTATKTDSLYVDLASIRHERSEDGTLTSIAWVVRAFRENRAFYAPDAAAGLMRVEIFCLPKLKRVTAAVALDAQGKVLQRTENPGGYDYYTSEAGTPEDTLTKAVCNDIKTSGLVASTWKAAIDWTRGVAPPPAQTVVVAKPPVVAASAKPGAAKSAGGPAKAPAASQAPSQAMVIPWNYAALGADSNFAYQPDVMAKTPDEAGLAMMFRYRQPQKIAGVATPVYGVLRTFFLRCSDQAVQLAQVFYFDASGVFAGEGALSKMWEPATRYDLADHLVGIYCVTGALPAGEQVIKSNDTQVVQQWLRDRLPKG